MLAPMLLLAVIPLSAIFLLSSFHDHDPRHNFEVTADAYVTQPNEYSLEASPKHKGPAVGKLSACTLPKGSRISHPTAYGRSGFKVREKTGYFDVTLPTSVSLDSTGCPAMRFTYFDDRFKHLEELKQSESLSHLGKTSKK